MQQINAKQNKEDLKMKEYLKNYKKERQVKNK